MAEGWRQRLADDFDLWLAARPDLAPLPPGEAFQVWLAELSVENGLLQVDGPDEGDDDE